VTPIDFGPTARSHKVQTCSVRPAGTSIGRNGISSTRPFENALTMAPASLVVSFTSTAT
jgi:hypothetical protein